MQNKFVPILLVASALISCQQASEKSTEAPRAPKGSTNDYTVVKVHIDDVRDQKNIFQVASECKNNPICVAAIKSISSYTGIPIDSAMSGLAVLGTNKKGEGTYHNINLPNGYSYCASEMKLTSIVTRDGPRGSLFLGRADPNGFYAETWTPVLPPPQGRTWVEGDLNIVGIRSEYAEWGYKTGKCFRPGYRVVFYCRGRGCEQGFADRGQSVDASNPPPAGGHNRNLSKGTKNSIEAPFVAPNGPHQ